MTRYVLAISTVVISILGLQRDARATCSCTTSGGSCASEVNCATSDGQGFFAQATAGYGSIGEDTSSGIGVEGQSVSGTGVMGAVAIDPFTVTPPAGNIGVFGFSESGGYAVYGSSSNGYGVYGADVAHGKGVYGSAATSPGYGGYFTSPGTGTAGTNAALYGNASGSGGTGVLGSGFGYGVYGETSTGTGAAGVYGYNSGTGGSGGTFQGTNGWGVYASDTSAGNGVTGTSSTGTGVYGQTANTGTSQAGVYGHNTSSGVGVYGLSASGYGVYGKASGASSGVYGVSANTISGGVLGNNTGGGFGVLGECSGTGCYAGYFTEQVYVPAGEFCNPTCVSDARLKKDVQPMVGALDQILQLHGVTYEWKDTTRTGQLPGVQRGFIAQDVAKVFPSWVGENNEGYKTLEVESKAGFALTVEAFREVKAENDELKAKSDKQQAQIDKLTDAVDKLTHGKDPVSGGPGFGPGVLALFAAGLAGATVLMMKRLGLSLAMVVGLLIAGRKKNDEK